MSLFSDITTSSIESNINSKIRGYIIAMDDIKKSEEPGVARDTKIQYFLGAIRACEDIKKDLIY